MLPPHIALGQHGSPRPKPSIPKGVVLSPTYEEKSLDSDDIVVNTTIIDKTLPHPAARAVDGMVLELEAMAEQLLTIYQRISALPAYTDAPAGLSQRLDKALALVTHFSWHSALDSKPISTPIREWRDAMSLAKTRQQRANQ